jgi:hypothetical protein
MTVIEIEHDGIHRRVDPVILASDCGRADHEVSRMV